MKLTWSLVISIFFLSLVLSAIVLKSGFSTVQCSVHLKKYSHTRISWTLWIVISMTWKSFLKCSFVSYESQGWSYRVISWILPCKYASYPCSYPNWKNVIALLVKLNKICLNLWVSMCMRAYVYIYIKVVIPKHTHICINSHQNNIWIWVNILTDMKLV